ncbi:hypothetical protein LTR85_000803 [Meristemomyces frigidus]|nr:hypothetical protein LTR85_000803 [Meristemomyces frigidus]
MPPCSVMNPSAALGSLPTNKAATMKASVGLLIIPQELRDQIYDHLLVDKESVVECPVRRFRHRENDGPTIANYCALSATCRQLKDEARAHFSARNIIAVWSIELMDEPSKYLTPLLSISGDVRRLALWRHRESDPARGRHEYISVLDLKINGTRIEHSVRTVGSGTAFLARDFYKTDPERTGSNEAIRRYEARVVAPAVKALQAALAKKGKLELGMLECLRRFLVKESGTRLKSGVNALPAQAAGV